MSDPNDWVGIATLIAIGVTLIGAWMMHRRLRNGSSRTFLLSVAALLLWLPVSVYLTSYVLIHDGGEPVPQWINYSYIAVDTIIPALLILIGAFGFLFAARTIARPD